MSVNQPQIRNVKYENKIPARFCGLYFYGGALLR